jgi:hypothetical protein
VSRLTRPVVQVTLRAVLPHSVCIGHTARVVSRLVWLVGAATLAVTLAAPAAPAPVVRARTGPLSAVAPLLADAEAIRGLRSRRALRVVMVSRDGMARIVNTQLRSAEATSLAPAWDRAYHLLGVLGADQNLARLVASSLDTGAAGLYDPVTGMLYVVDAAGGGAPASVIVHEATHALQDQWFALRSGRYQRVGDSDGALAADALIEGDATDVQARFLAQAGLVDVLGESLASISGLAASGPPLPAFLQREQLFPYLAGQRFVQTLRAAGGERLVNAAFRAPPRTTASVLDPSRYLDGDPAALTPPPPPLAAGARRLIDTTFGAEDVAALTGSDAAAATWRGGRITLDQTAAADRVVVVVVTRAPRLVARALRSVLTTARIAASGGEVRVVVSARRGAGGI